MIVNVLEIGTNLQTAIVTPFVAFAIAWAVRGYIDYLKERRDEDDR